jgi:hypothetical protein
VIKRAAGHPIFLKFYKKIALEVGGPPGLLTGEILYVKYRV